MSQKLRPDNEFFGMTRMGWLMNLGENSAGRVSGLRSLIPPSLLSYGMVPYHHFLQQLHFGLASMHAQKNSTPTRASKTDPATRR